MTLYQNGKIPLGNLILLAHGVDENGYWEHRLSAGSAAKLTSAQAYALRKWGRAPKIKDGWNGYRPLDVQAAARIRACNEGDCNAAAAAGWSSHGGTWIDSVFTGGKWVDALAVDIDPNGLTWAQVDEAMQQAGWLIHGITVARAGRSEPWHYIDLHCWDAVPTGGGSTPFPDPTTEPPLIVQEDDMPTFIRTAQHGHYSVTPGSVVGIGDPKFIDSVVWVAAQTKGGPLPLVLDVAPTDLGNWIFYLSGCPADQIPAPNYAWYAAIAYAKTPPAAASTVLDDATLARIAQAVSDEFARRIAS